MLGEAMHHIDTVVVLLTLNALSLTSFLPEKLTETPRAGEMYSTFPRASHATQQTRCWPAARC